MAYLWLICLVAAMGGLLFGYDWVVIGGAKPFYEPYFGISESPLSQGWAMSSALLGCLAGAVVSGTLSDRYGRKRLLILSGFLFTLSAIGTALVSSFAAFNVFRLLGGAGIGLASSLSPMFIAEVSPAEMRGRFVSINQLTIVIGILAAQIINWLIAEQVPDDATLDFIRASWNGQSGWRWMFAAETVPALAFFLLMFLVPESPRWLVKAGDPELARRILTRVGGDGYADSELRNIQDTLSEDSGSQLRLRELFAPQLRGIVALGVFLAVFQQWCGINSIFNYAQEIFAAAGYGVSGIMFNIVITGVVNVLFTFVAIAFVDRVGRRVLMLIGAAGLAVIYSILGACYLLDSKGIHMLVLVVTAIAVYAMSLAPVTWVLISEIYPNRIRGAGMSVAVTSLWTACLVLTFCFPILTNGLETYAFQWDGLGVHGTFFLYASICLVSFVGLYQRLPETKGKSLEAIERELTQ